MAAVALFAGPPLAEARMFVPAGFIGMNFEPAVVPAADRGRELAMMAATGVRSVRVAWYWADLQPSATAGFDFAATDSVVLAAARAGLTVLPCVLGAPAWAQLPGGAPIGAPSEPRGYARLMAALAARYGPGGDLWRQHPDVQRHAIRAWQIWNEPDLSFYWRQPFGHTYAALLRTSHDAVKAVDPNARIVLGGLTNTAWDDLRDLYAAGAGDAFDEVALHPYTRQVSDVVRFVRLSRQVMNSNGDARKPIRLTELSWPSSAGRLGSPFFAETTESGQAATVTAVLNTLSEQRTRLGLSGIYWYTWISRERRNEDAFEFAGLRKLTRRGPVSKPSLAAFARAMRALRLAGRP
jgi:hypothetical protein